MVSPNARPFPSPTSTALIETVKDEPVVIDPEKLFRLPRLIVEVLEDPC